MGGGKEVVVVGVFVGGGGNWQASTLRISFPEHKFGNQLEMKYLNCI